jgi:diadenylate cyclase
VRRIHSEVNNYLVELGTEGRLLSLQLNELVAGVDKDRVLLMRDYLVPVSNRKKRGVEKGLEELDALTEAELLDLPRVARAFGFSDGAEVIDQTVTPRGYRLLARVPRLPDVINDRIVGHFGGLPRLLAATSEDLQQVEGVGEARARSVRDGLSRIAEASILDRFV